MIGSFVRGVTLATLNWKMILVLLVANIVFALPVVLPLFILVLQTAGGTAAAEKMMADKLDVDWVIDVVNLQMPGSSFDTTGIQTGALLAVAAITYLLVGTFFSGGILVTFATDRQRFSVRDFWTGCGLYFWRFLRLTIISIFFYAAAIAVYAVIHRWVGRVDDAATAYDTVVYKRWGGFVVLLLMLWSVNMLFDYARIMTVANDSRKMIRQTFAAIRFNLRHIFVTCPLYILFAITGLAVMVFLVWLRGAINQSSLPAVLLAILVGQLTIFSRMWSRVAAYAGELDFYCRITPPPVVEVRPLEPDLAAVVKDSISHQVLNDIEQKFELAGGESHEDTKDHS